LFFLFLENSSNFVPLENYSTSTDDWLSQYGGQKEMMTRCQCSACYFTKPQVSHKKCVPIYNGGQNDENNEHTGYQPPSYNWHQLGG